MVVRMRVNRSQRNSRRSHHAYKGAATFACPECGVGKVPHRMCENCGVYKGRVVVDVNAEIARKEERRKAKQEALGEEASNEKKAEEKKEA